MSGSANLCLALSRGDINDDTFLQGVARVVQEEERLEVPPERGWDDVLDEKLALHRVRVDAIIKKGLQEGGKVIAAVDSRLSQLTESQDRRRKSMFRL